MDEMKYVDNSDLADSVLSNDVLVEYITKIILELRSKNNYGVELKQKLKELSEIDIQLKPGLMAEDLFQYYEKIKEVSLQLRKLLSQYIDIANYDNINYALYYKGKRYAVENLDVNWLTQSKITGELELRLNEVEKEFKDIVLDEYQSALAEAFNKHYATFLNAIEGTYNGVIGRGGALNYGHIAEAYEAHMEEHHSVEYKILNNLFTSTEMPTTIDKMMIAYEVESNSISYWANHEGISSAWQHIRDSLGTQRGTVAGDVLSRQVKQGKNSGSSRLRLARLGTLITGVETYSLILGDVPAEEVAQKIANYISEPVRQMSEKIINNILNEDVKKEMRDLNEKTLNKNLVRI